MAAFRSKVTLRTDENVLGSDNKEERCRVIT
jgi:hypothetical protein